MPQVPRVLWAILAVLVAMLAAGMLYNDESSLEFQGLHVQQHQQDSFNLHEEVFAPPQCTNVSCNMTKNNRFALEGVDQGPTLTNTRLQFLVLQALRRDRRLVLLPLRDSGQAQRGL